MISIRLKTIALLSVIMGATALAVCPCKKVQFNTRPMSQGAQYRQQAPVQQAVRPVAQQPVAQEQKDMEAAKQASIATEKQREQKAQQQELDEIAIAQAESMCTQDEADLEQVNEAILKQAVAESLVGKDSKSSSTVSQNNDNQETKAPATLKQRIKNWFSIKWEATKTGFGIAKDYVKSGWTKTKSGFSKLWAKISRKKSEVQTTTA